LRNNLIEIAEYRVLTFNHYLRVWQSPACAIAYLLGDIIPRSVE